ncbi:STAS domain-containing protein [Cellvibrio sp. OA-2007]|uniref:STAS domain-containing protein n=1 Tax=Cellvibrio sp. OA-2007 TaxID=529823 RepID=UPI0007804938|nr:STAS domain-containing protein [Cellvibrio sp. OA-2007]
MNISRKKSKDTSTLIFEGDLTIYYVAQIKDELFADYEKLADRVAFDLSSVGEIDTAGVQLLLFAKKFFSSVRRPLFISKSNESVESVLTALDVNTQFAIES